METKTYILVNDDGSYGYLELEKSFDVNLLKDFGYSEVISYLLRNNIYFKTEIGCESLQFKLKPKEEKFFKDIQSYL